VLKLVVGLGECCRICESEMQNDRAHIKELSDYLYNRLMHEIPHVYLNGDKVTNSAR
jgi:cysteine sulfinate desulfinase/cysteine desulfurase-like protein